MVSASRILTVSYGTFSCTLEGFDEPFSTMKSIAEYFRDLAADDRYFGAEPPTPDAEMLHRIAEREIQRRVEARVSDHGVVLRPAEAEDRPEPQPARPALTASPAVAPAPAVAVPVEAPEAVAEPAAEPVVANAPAPVVAPVAEAAPQVQPPAPADYVEDEDDTAFFDEAPIEAAFAGVLEDSLVVDEAPAMDLDALLDQPIEDAEEAALETDEDFAGEGFDDENEEDLAVRAEEDEDTVEETFEAEEIDELASLDGAAPNDDAAIAAVLGSLGHAPATEEAAPEPVAEAEIEDEDEDDFDELDALFEAAEDELDDTEEAFDDEDDNVFADEEAAPVIRVRRAEIEAEADRIPAAADDSFDPDADFEVPGESTLSPEDEAALVAELAEVERDARAELAQAETDTAVPADARRQPLRTAFDDADMSETDVAIDRILEKTNSQLESGEASRRRSAIQHLKAAVQATRADRDAGSAPVAEDDDEEPYRKDLAQVVRPRRATVEDGSEPEPHRRLAPLVLVSEQRIDKPADAGAAAPVQPRRVRGSKRAAAAPELRVVSERARPAAAPAAAEPSQPAAARAYVTGGSDIAVARAMAEVDPDEEAKIAPLADGFVAFLAHQDAKGHDEIVEAAVAYVTQEVGRPHVSRPQLIGLVQTAIEDMSRENALRAFGNLLRDGRVQKVKRGVFVLTEKSRFFDSDA